MMRKHWLYFLLSATLAFTIVMLGAALGAVLVLCTTNADLQQKLITSWDEASAQPMILPQGAQPPWGDEYHLINNTDAVDPTLERLQAFLSSDRTDRRPYASNYSCGHFARDVHNNAEVAGIRASWVYISFEDRGQPHALNLFRTSDAGEAWVDCAKSSDAVTMVEIGRQYADLGVVAGMWVY